MSFEDIFEIYLDKDTLFSFWTSPVVIRGDMVIEEEVIEDIPGIWEDVGVDDVIIEDVTAEDVNDKDVIGEDVMGEDVTSLFDVLPSELVSGTIGDDVT